MKGGWILKSEPSEYSIHHLVEQRIGRWDGVRNYQARNFLRDLTIGEKLFFYHSNCPEPGIYGTMTVHRTGYPDPTAIDRSSKYYDAKASDEKNPWIAIDVKIDQAFQRPLYLTEIKELPLGDCRLTAKGNRLSVIPITAEQAQILQVEINRLNQNNNLNNDQTTDNTSKKKRKNDSSNSHPVPSKERSVEAVDITRQETQPLEKQLSSESAKKGTKRKKNALNDEDEEVVNDHDKDDAQAEKKLTKRRTKPKK